MRCEERERLWERYNQALRILSQCVEDMDHTTNTAVFAAHIISVKAANTLCKAAREIWEEHLKNHGCDADAIVE